MGPPFSPRAGILFSHALPVRVPGEKSLEGETENYMEPQVGSILEGKVTSITNFGAFVALEGGKSGLVHISEIANTYVNDVHDFLQAGQSVKVLVLSAENGRINLSIKKAQDPPPKPEGGAPRVQQSRPRSGGARPVGFTGARKPAEPTTFEDKLKQFMASSDSKLSEHHMNDRKSSRRGGGGSRRGQ